MSGLSSRNLATIVQRGDNIAKRNNYPAVAEADLTEVAMDFVLDDSPEINEITALLALREVNSQLMIPTLLHPEFQG